MEHDLFEKLNGLPVIICKTCQHGVWPSEIVRHLKSNVHRVKHAEADAIQTTVQQWEDVAPDADAVVIPHQVDEPFTGLPTYPDGLLCRRDYPGCQYIGRSLDNMRRHWRTVHGWSQYARGGRIRREERIQQEAELRRSYVIVTCQRIFPSRKGSHYIHVRGGTEEEPHIPVRADQVDQAVDEVVHAYRTQEAEAGQRVEVGELDDANSWLRVTGWTKYLTNDVPYDRLRDSVMTPEDSTDPVEQGVHRIWNAMDAVVRKSQQTVNHTGQAIRIEAVRSEKGQTPYRPLLAYMDAESVAKHVHPWQQILAFFARTQAPHTWKSPPYGMTARQRKKWRQLWQCATTQATNPDPADEQDVDPKLASWIMTDIERACLEFCIELMNQTYHAQEYESPLICAMAVLGRGETGWRDPESYPPILSAVIKVARFMIVQKALWLDPDVMRIIETWQQPQNCATWALRSAAVLDDLDHDSAYGSSEETPDPPSSPPISPIPRGEQYPQMDTSPARGSNRRKTFQEQVTWMVSQLMVRGRHTPMETLQDWRTYGLRIHYNTTAPGHVTWMQPDRLLYKDMQFSMGDFRGFVHGLTGVTRQILCEELMFGQTPAIPWHALYDDPTQGAVGWNFLRDQRTRWPVEGPTWMMERVRSDPSVQGHFIHRRQPTQFQPRLVMQYLQRVARFKEKLAVLVHVVGGQPSRGKELLSLQHANTETNHRRNVFIEDGMVTFVSAYHKGFYASNDVKIIHRYVPREVGELVVWYLWLVLPFVQHLEAWHQHSVSPESRESPESPESPADSRHGRKQAYVWGPDPGTGRQWTSERFREVLKRETKMRLQYPINIQAYRDIAIGISRRWMRPSSAFTSNVQEDKDAAQAALDADAEDGMDEAQWIGHIADLQAAHSSHVAGMVYARGIMDQAGTTAHRQRMFRVSSTDWHRFLGFASADQPVEELGKRKRSPWEDEAEESRVYRRHRLNTMDMTSALQQMTGQGTIQFRGVQAPALRAIQDGESPVVAVMPTGGGKSMLFMLPAFAEPSGTTIVVVPLLALRSDMIRRCQALGISCVAWESRRPPDEATIVLVTPESAVTDDFHTFINRLQQTRRLDRIVIDECHVVLNNKRDFRPQLRQLGRLNHARTQMVLLTATLPPQLESTLLQRMQYPREQVSMFRARTSRPNVAYRVWQPFGVRASRDWFAAEPVTAFIQERIQQAHPGKVIIYANVVRQVVDMARIIGCEAFHSQQIDKPSILERFTQGHTRVIAATSALGMGVDIPDIRCIIHIGAPRCLLDYAQESGRAGRDGQTSEAIIIQPEGPLRWPQDASPGDTELVAEYMEIVPGVGCCDDSS